MTKLLDGIFACPFVANIIFPFSSIFIFSESKKIVSAFKFEPKNIKIKWVVNSKQNPSVLENTVKEINWLNGKPYVWVACEFNKMKSLRNFFQKNKKISKNEMYISSYWKLGLDQEEHKLVKKEDSVKWDNN